jgi:hypothetical protein
MPRYGLTIAPYQYEVAPGVLLPMLRPSVSAEVAGLAVRPNCFLDTGAPLSVVSHTVGRLLRYTRVPVTNNPIPKFAHGQRLPPARADELLVWEGLPCELGVVSVSLRNVTSGETSGSLRLLAKFVLTPSRYANDAFVILGMAFLADNGAALRIDGQPWGAAGHLDVP